MSDSGLSSSKIKISTSIGHANGTQIELRGYDLVNELMGVLSYGEVMLLAVTGQRPSRGRTRLAEAVLVCLADHGLQPSALTARLTYAAAPDAVQGALAAGVLGAGSSLLGSMEQAGCFLSEIATLIDDGVHEDDAVERAVGAKLAKGMRLAGFGHRLHRDGDPRAARLFMLARDENVAVDEVRRLLKIGEEVRRRTGRTLPVNATGAAAAVLLGIGVPWQLHRGFAVASRIAGLLAHIGEEIVRPLSPAIREELRRASWLSEEGDERDADGDF